MPHSPQIAEAAVLGLPHEQWGQKIAAVVVLHPDAAKTGRNGKSWGPMDMRRALKDQLAGYKIPQEMRVLDSIPRNAMGKGECRYQQSWRYDNANDVNSE